MKKKLIPFAILPIILGGCSFNSKTTTSPSPTGEPSPVVPSVKPTTPVKPSPSVEPSPTEVVPTVKPTEPTKPVTPEPTVKPVTPTEPVVPTPTKEPTNEPYYNEEFEKFFNPSSKIEIELGLKNFSNSSL